MQSLQQIINVLETVAPLQLQESYDNSGLVYGDPTKSINKAIAALDLTEEVIQEAITLKAELIILHHPPIFKPIKRLSHQDLTSLLLVQAIKADIAVYACHTNLDNVLWGVNGEIAKRLGIKNFEVLSPMNSTHQKLVTFVPIENLEAVREALFSIGAGAIGNYHECSFISSGEGTFLPREGANPWIGKIGQRHTEKESRLEIIFPIHLKQQILDGLHKAHPYETVAYDLLSLDNTFSQYGAGVIGNLPESLEEPQLLDLLKSTFKTSVIRHNPLTKRTIRKIALCGGSGKSLINNALSKKADAYITADLSYHDFFMPGKRMLLADIGHYESEQFTSDRLVAILNEKFPNFAVLKSGVNTNPVNYFL